MRSKTGLIFFLLAFSLCALRLSIAQQSYQCIAVITEVNGEALLRKANSSEFAKAYWGTQLFQGDQIKTSAKSEVKLLFSNNNLVTLGPNSAVTISGKEAPVTEASSTVRNISSAMMVDLSALTSKRDNRKDVGALAGLRSIDVGYVIELVSPYNTLIKTNRPTFSWLTEKSYDNCIVNLYNSSGLVWSKKVSSNSLVYPENEKGLEFGENYFWNVEGEALINTEKSASHKFSVLSVEKSREVEEQESAIRNAFTDEPESSSLHSVLGAYYIDLGLLQDAISEFQIISKINPDAPLPHEILGSLYSDVGNKDKAIEELQKALALAKGKEK